MSGVEAGPALRRRLLVLSAATIVLALGIAGVSLATVFDRHLERRVAQELQVKLLELAGAFALDEDGAEIETPSGRRQTICKRNFWSTE